MRASADAASAESKKQREALEFAFLEDQTRTERELAKATADLRSEKTRYASLQLQHEQQEHQLQQLKEADRKLQQLSLSFSRIRSAYGALTGRQVADDSELAAGIGQALRDFAEARHDLQVREAALSS